MLKETNFGTTNITVQQSFPTYSIGKVGIVSSQVNLFNGQEYLEFKNASQVEETFGTNSNEYISIKNVLNQSKYKINTVDNYSFIFIPFANTQDAIRGSVLTGDLTANLNNFLAISDGKFRITVDGTPIDLTGLDFTKKKDYAGIVKQLNDLPALENVDVTLIDGKYILFESINAGSDSSISIGAISGGTGTNLIGSSYLNISSATTTAGANSGLAVANFITKLKDVQAKTLFSFFTIASELDIAKIIEIQNAIQSDLEIKNNVCFVYNVITASDTALLKSGIYTVNGKVDGKQVINYYGDFVNIKENDLSKKEFVKFNITMACAFASNDITKANKRVFSNHSKAFDGFQIDPSKLIQSEHETAVSNLVGTYGVYPQFGSQFFNASGRYNGFQIATILTLQGTISNQIRKIQNIGTFGIQVQGASNALTPSIEKILQTARDNLAIELMKDNADISAYSNYARVEDFVASMKERGFYVYVDENNVVNNTINCYIYFTIAEEVYVINKNIMITIN